MENDLHQGHELTSVPGIRNLAMIINNLNVPILYSSSSSSSSIPLIFFSIAFVLVAFVVIANPHLHHLCFVQPNTEFYLASSNRQNGHQFSGNHLLRFVSRDISWNSHTREAPVPPVFLRHLHHPHRHSPPLRPRRLHRRNRPPNNHIHPPFRPRLHLDSQHILSHGVCSSPFTPCPSLTYIPRLSTSCSPSLVFLL